MRFLIIALLATVTPALTLAQGVNGDIPRVGTSISMAEKEYFHLFRDEDEYVRTDLIPIADNKVRCIVHRESSDSLILVLDSMECAVLGTWILHYERFSLAGDEMSQMLLEFLGADHPTMKLRTLSGLHRRGIIEIDLDRFEDPAHPMIVTRSGETLREPLLTISDSALFVWEGKGLYDATTAYRHLRRIPVDSIVFLTAFSSTPFGKVASLIIYPAWSAMLYGVSRNSTGYEKEGIPVEVAAVAFAIPIALPGLLIAWLVSLQENSETYSTAEDSLAVMRGIPTLIPHSLFGKNIPPEFYALEIVGADGMKVYGDGDSHPFEYLGDPVYESKWMLGLETLVHMYDVHKRPISTHIGLSLSHRFALTEHRPGAAEWYLALRPRIAAGSFLTAECSMELVRPGVVSFFAGFAYTHVFEELGGSAEGHLNQSYYYSRYERESILQESFAVLGFSVAHSYGSVELQFRHVLQSALHEQQDESRYATPTPNTLTVYDVKGFSGGSIMLNVRL